MAPSTYMIQMERERQKGCYVTYRQGAVAAAAMLVLIIAVVLVMYVTTVHNHTSDTTHMCSHGNGVKSQCQSANVTNPSTTPPVQHDGRLPRDLSPVLYKLELFPDIYGSDPDNFIFSGSVWIQMECLIPTNKVVMNINKINITGGTIFFGAINSSEPTSPSCVDHSIDTKWQFLEITLDSTLKPGVQYYVKMNFTGDLKTDFAGLYLSTFMHRTSNRYVAATQFSPTDARKAFPCFDEPDRKAQFDITLVRKPGYVSLSNMPQIGHEPRSGSLIADVYERTPKMSTYLLAFVVGDVTSADRQARPGLKFTAWADKASINMTETALTIGAAVLAHFEQYFGIPFPLPKQDMLAVPETAVAAMENWGLIIYNENRIYYDPLEYSSASLQESANTISHEIAHQWFGNLVTMKWWSDLILKEGFAVYFARIGMHHVYPSWNIMDLFPMHRIHSVFEIDGLTSSHPVYMKLADTTEIRQVFDQIAYGKGGILIRMLNTILGEDIFRRALKRYLYEFQYGNVGHDDLWYTIGNQTRDDGFPLDIKGIMDTWMLQMNYPVIKITQTHAGHLHVTQERFLSNANSVESKIYTSPFNYTWRVPLTVTTSNKPNFNQTYKDIIWMNAKELEIVDKGLPLLVPRGWVIGNVQQWGFYRVNYDLRNWDSLLQQLKTDHTIIHAVNRGQIINDAWSLAKASRLSLQVALRTLEYLDRDMDYIPWAAADTAIRYVDTFLRRTEVYADFKKFVNSKTKPPFLSLGMDNRKLPHQTSLLREMVVRLASEYEIPECTKNSRRLFDGWKSDTLNNRVNPDIRESVYCTALRGGGGADWDFVYDQYRQEDSVNEKLNLLNALACPNNTALLQRLLGLTLNADVIQRQDAINVIIYVAGNVDGQDLAWNLLSSRWDYFLSTYSESLFGLTKLVSGVTAGFTTRAQLQQLEAFIASTANLGTASRAFKQAVEKTKANIKWMEDNFDTVKTWLRAQHL